MRFTSIKYIPHFYLLFLTAGTVLCIPNIFVNRFIVAPSLWVQAGISIGIIGYILLKKGEIGIPPKGYIYLISAWAIYHIYYNWGNTEKITTIAALIGAFFLLYAIWTDIKDKRAVFAIFTLIGLVISLWGLAQFFGLLRSYNSSFAITGPFDNPAGISASLVVLLPFSLYCCSYSKKMYRVLSIIATCIIISVIVLTKARAAIIGTTAILLLFAISILKNKNIKLTLVHYSAILVVSILLFLGLFFIKKDSANGRLLIWKCSTQLMLQKPMLGHGGNGFNANYMNEQATYLASHPDSKYIMLADNVREPFNEFIRWGVNYGIVGLSLILLLVTVPLWASRKHKSPELLYIRLSLLSIGICAFFSYPFSYPFIKLMTVALLAFLLAEVRTQRTTINNNLWTRVSLSLFSIALLSATAYQRYLEREWHTIAHKSLRGETLQMLPQYESLHTHLRYSDLFLYNYAAELNVVGHYDESMQIANECNKLWADYDLHMLMADNCLMLQRYVDAETYLKQASAMCPVKFMPPYKIAELYIKTEQKEDALILAQQIVNKEVKVPSSTITSIKNKMQALLDDSNSVIIK